MPTFNKIVGRINLREASESSWNLVGGLNYYATSILLFFSDQSSPPIDECAPGGLCGGPRGSDTR